MILAVAVVDDVAGAIAHIRRYGSNHTEAIITEDDSAAAEFFARLDSAILMRNASTQFADGGEFGLGGEIGIATGKMHARGPVGAEQLTSFKYLVTGDAGRVRKRNLIEHAKTPPAAPPSPRPGPACHHTKRRPEIAPSKLCAAIAQRDQVVQPRHAARRDDRDRHGPRQRRRGVHIRALHGPVAVDVGVDDRGHARILELAGKLCHLDIGFLGPALGRHHAIAGVNPHGHLPGKRARPRAPDRGFRPRPCQG